MSFEHLLNLSGSSYIRLHIYAKTARKLYVAINLAMYYVNYSTQIVCTIIFVNVLLNVCVNKYSITLQGTQRTVEHYYTLLDAYFYKL